MPIKHNKVLFAPINLLKVLTAAVWNEDHSGTNAHGHTSADDGGTISLGTPDLSNYVTKVTGKALSENDLTASLKISYDGAVSHAGSTHAPSNAQKNSDIAKSEIESVLTGELTSHSHAGGGGLSHPQVLARGLRA